MFEFWDIYEPFKTGKMAHGSTLAELDNGNIIVAWYSGTTEGNSDVGIYSSTYIVNQNKWTQSLSI